MDFLKEIGGRGPKVAPKRGPEVDPKLDPLCGAQVLGNTMESKGFGAFGFTEGPSFWHHLEFSLMSFPRPKDFGIFQDLEEPLKAKWPLANPGNMHLLPGEVKV